MTEQSSSDLLGATRLPKRRRPATACEQCRRRKVRCDQSLPCGPCKRSRAGLGCSYQPEVFFNISSRVTASKESDKDTCATPTPFIDPGFNQPITPRQEAESRESLPFRRGNLEGQNLSESTLSNLPAPRLRNGLNKTRLFGRSHWIYTAERLVRQTTQFHPICCFESSSNLDNSQVF